MADLNLFQYEDQQVRTILIDGEPWFVIADVCKVLELSNPTMAAQTLDADDLSTTEAMDSMGRKQTARTTNEAGVYQLIFQSRKPSARDFRRWVTKVVLPEIRKTGSFGTQAALTGPELMARALIQADGIIRSNTLALAAAQPAIDYDKRYISNEDATLVSDFAAHHGMSSVAMFALLKEVKIVYRTKVTEHFSKKRDRIVEDFEYRSFADYLKFFDLRPQHNAPRHHNGKVRQTLYVRQAHSLELGSLIGLGEPSTELDVAS